MKSSSRRKPRIKGRRRFSLKLKRPSLITRGRPNSRVTSRHLAVRKD